MTETVSRPAVETMLRQIADELSAGKLPSVPAAWCEIWERLPALPATDTAECERLLLSLAKIAELRFSEADEPFDEALDIADAALLQGGLVATPDAECERLRGALEKINALRNDIIGRQSINWSLHIYPLVAVLDEAGFEGEGYEEARGKIVSLIGECERLRTALAFYAAPENWSASGVFLGTQDNGMWCDTGDHARAALKDQGNG